MRIIQTCLEGSIDGLTVSNTTPIFSNNLQSKSGGLSGQPIFENMLEMIRDIKDEVGSKIDINACGGISSGKDVLEAIKAGAKTTQIYTSLIYEGPGIVKTINQELLSLLKENEDLPLEYAKKINLNMNRFMRDFENQSIIDQIEREKQEMRNQFNKISLPTFLIQGKILTSTQRNLDFISKVIEDELKK